MDIKTLTRGLAYVVLAGALFTAAIALNNRQYPTPEASKSKPSPTPGALDAELARCKAIGAEATNDAVCKAVWEANRERFFESKKLYQDRVPNPAPATSTPQPPGHIAGQPQ
jgi:conjugative transfer region protein TrbK